MSELLSPKYIMALVGKVEDAITNYFVYPQEVRYYIEKWHESDDYRWENFRLSINNDYTLNLRDTLHGVPDETLLKMAIDMGVETPDFIPCVPEFKNDLKANYESAFESFTRALKQVEEHPDLAIGLANSTLEGLLKNILQDDRIKVDDMSRKTLYSLTQAVLKEFRLFPGSMISKEFSDIGSSLLKLSQQIESLRSEKTSMHGKQSGDYIIDDPTCAYFIVNSVSTVGLFISAFYRKNYPKPKPIENTDGPFDDLPF